MPPAFNISREQARFQMFAANQDVDLTMAHIAHCINLWLTNLSLPVVCQNECVGKGIEALTVFILNDVRQWAEINQWTLDKAWGTL